MRYFLASLAGLGVDYAVTLLLYHLAGLDLSVAAAISFCLVGSVFYLVHEFWTFRQETSRFSARRMIANIGVLLLSGIVRVTIIAVLEWLQSPAGIWISAYFAAGVAGSFTTNYLLNRYFVFRR
ncbi:MULTISPECIES: GtrA family protein [unclassified Hyphomonas]|uniref:GtrA family protein n=1 Tax=unclassified Hyphomonas TaxID=2630699 RepID=UPI000AB8A010|nr:MULTISPECIES: GtrA family protein [unclassified Hyphomonas]